MRNDRPRIVVDVSNLTIHRTKFIKTGIQEVIYQTLIALARLRPELGNTELILLPQLPRRFGNPFSAPTVVPYPNAPRSVLETIEAELALPSAEIWGIDLRAREFRLPDEEILEILRGADRLHIQGMVNIAPLAEHLRAGEKPGPELTMTVYDLIPVYFPEYCPDGIPRWYQEQYLPALGRYVSHAYCISRNTAIDLRSHPASASIPRISVLPLPFETSRAQPGRPDLLKELGLRSGEYLVHLGSLEPRKNFEALLEGFETYRNLHENSRLKLVMVGATGWKNARIETRIRKSAHASDIIRTGYLPDPELSLLLREAAALGMLSHYEGYGLPVAQAYSLGRPAITTLGSSLPEACGGEGIFVDPSDPYSVAAGIEVSLTKSGRRNPRSEMENLTWSQYARGLIGGPRPC